MERVVAGQAEQGEGCAWEVESETTIDGQAGEDGGQDGAVEAGKPGPGMVAGKVRGDPIVTSASTNGGTAKNGAASLVEVHRQRGGPRSRAKMKGIGEVDMVENE
jgi:hypothetical protein